MTFEALLNSLMISDTNSLGFLDVLLTMCIPFFLSFLITYVYRMTQRHNNYSTNFVHSIFMFSVLSAVITLLIGSNIAQAFGLVGALSIIRFRNALKEPIDAVYIFWALAVGMASGTGFYLAAILLAFIMAAMVLFVHWTGYGEPRYLDTVLKVFIATNAEKVAAEGLEKTLDKSCKAFRLVNILFDSSDPQKTYLYSIRTEKKMDLGIFRDEIAKIQGVERVYHINKESSLFAD